MAVEDFNWVIGVLLDAVATFCGTIGKQLLRFAATSGNPWYYPLGLVFTGVIDPAFDVAAYSFAAASIVTACAGLVIMWNVLLAPYTLGEPLTLERKLACALIFLGTLLTGVFGSHEEVERTVTEYLDLFTRPAACVYFVALGLSVGLLAIASRRAKEELRGFHISALAGLLAGNTFTTKATVEMLECVATNEAVGCDENPFLTPWPYLLICCTILFSGGSLAILAYALVDSEALLAITVFEGFMIISGAASGNVVLNEASGLTPGGAIGYVSATVIILLGLSVLLKGELSKGKVLL